MRHASPITVSAVDLPRLERLLDALPEFGPVAEALDEELAQARVVAPAGSALLGATPGEHLSWPVPGGKEQQVELLALEPAEA